MRVFAQERRRLSHAPCFVVLAGGYLCALATHVSSLWRGVDLQDEAYYIAFAYRFARGDRPFIDEISIHQLTGVLLAPLMRLYLEVVGSTDGIVLAARFLYLLVLLATLLVFAYCLRDLVGWWWALLVCLPLVPYAPMSISGLGYNSLGSLAFLASCGWALKAVVEQRGWGPAAVSGALAGIAIMAYPPLAIGVIVSQGILFAMLMKRRGLAASSVPLAALLVTVAPLLVYVVWIGPEELRSVYAFTVGDGVHVVGLRKLAGSIAVFVRFVVECPLPFIAGVAAVLLRKRPPLSLAIISTIPVIAWMATPGTSLYHPMTAVTLLIMVLGLLAPVLFLLFVDEPVARVIMLTLALPGLAGGYAVTYASQLGIAVSGLGMLPAAVATILFAIVFGRRRTEGMSVGAGRIQRVLVVVLVCMLTAAMAATRYSTVFHEQPGVKLAARVEGGPWDGLMTTHERKLMVESLDRDTAYLVSPNDRVYCTGWVPGAYLAANARVGAVSIQGGAPVSAETLMLVIEDRYWWPERGPDDSFKSYLHASGFQMVDETPWYRIYKRP